MAPRRDRGDTLIEIVITVVIAAVAVTALISSLATAANAARAQRDGARADTVMRNYAEAIKSAAGSCSPGGQLAVAYTPPDGFAVGAEPDGGVCPAANHTTILTLSVSGPNDMDQAMQVVVRTP